MQRHHSRYRGGPFLRRPGLPPFGRSGLLGDLIVGGLGYLIGRQQVQNQYQQRQPQANAQSDQLAQLRLLGQLRRIRRVDGGGISGAEAENPPTILKTSVPRKKDRCLCHLLSRFFAHEGHPAPDPSGSGAVGATAVHVELSRKGSS